MSGVHVAPMMGYSHRHGRRLWKMLCAPAVLYTEMHTANAVLHSRGESLNRMLHLPPQQSPTVLQLAGDNAKTMAQAAKIGAGYGYDAININCGCPSGRAQKGNFGACLMSSPKFVAELVCETKHAAGLPVTVKCRTAIDNANPEQCLGELMREITKAGANGIIVHARRALLAGLNPKQNRTAPPLDYKTPLRLRAQYPNLPMIVNGGITQAEDAREMLRKFDGVMIGRAAVRNPYLLARLAEDEFNIAPPTRKEALQQMLTYAREEPPREWRKIAVATAALFHGEPGASKVRRLLSTSSPLSGAPV